VSTPDSRSDWARLFRIASALIRQVNSEQTIIDHWTLGGGTALMLQIDHRDSRDVDIFLSDPQLLSFLDPRINDFQFERRPDDYAGDGTRFLKLRFERTGEIDFIVARSMTAAPTIATHIAGQRVLLETIPEVVVKKVYYRGRSLKPRDIFDIAAVAEDHSDSLIKELRGYRSEVIQALASLDGLNVDFVNQAISELIIRDRYSDIAKTAIERSKEILRAV
jgi:hypothetical protein